MSNFDNCLLVWMFSNATSFNKIEKLQKRALRLLQNNHHLSYKELLGKTNSSTINLKTLWFLCVEIQKTANNLNHSFMKQIFELRESNRSVREKCPLNLNIPSYNQFAFGKENLKTFRYKNLEEFSYHIKSSKHLKSFKTAIKNWNGINCKHVICRKI